MQESDVFEWFLLYWPYIFTAVTTVFSLIAAGHAILRKRDVRSALGWAGLIVLSPGVGALLYFLFGINRVQRKAVALRTQKERLPYGLSQYATEPEELGERCPEHREVLVQIAKAVSFVNPRPLLQGNHVDVLVNGEEAYPAMLEAMRLAQGSITLVTYIFDSDSLGLTFVEELVAAHKRGVAVRVLIDAVGVRYSFPHVHRLLRKEGVPVALFIPFRNISLFNLRTHRKILVVDGQLGFTGGMNIRLYHLVQAPSKLPTADVHFRLEGPIVSQLQEVFAEDWQFTTREALQGDVWFRGSEPKGSVIARGIADGPDQSMTAMALTLQAAIAAAKQRVRIVTPYFLPDMSLITALGVAAARGIDVDIIIPSRINLRLVQWACWAQLWQIMGYGCRVWLSAGPFDHSKLMTVDGVWTLFGSTNWDLRSLRLNFEFNVEAHDLELVRKIDGLIEERLVRAKRLTIAELEGRPLWIRLRDGLARLLSPYL
jgi:cardiolipin synthase